MKTKEQIEQDNKKIQEAILISQMMDTPGYKIFENYLKNKINPDMVEDPYDKDVDEMSIRYQDILRLTHDMLDEQKGTVAGFLSILNWFRKEHDLALNPMVDPVTGQVEILNKKQNGTTRKRTNKK